MTDLDGNTTRPAPGDTLEYTVTFTNSGLDPAAARASPPTPSRPDTTYVPGSLEIVSGPNAGPKTDAAGDDQAEFDAAGKRRPVPARHGCQRRPPGA